MKIEVNIEKKYFYLLAIILVLGSIVMIVNAYSGNVGHTSTQIDEVDPTVATSVKDGVSWGELSGIPAGFADGVDDEGSTFPVDWTPVEISLGELREAAGTTEYDLSASIPASAKEVLVYIWIRKGTGGSSGNKVYRIYTAEGSINYIQKFYIYSYDNGAWTFNSDNLWFPLTTDRKLYVNLDVGIPNYKASGIEILGYR